MTYIRFLEVASHWAAILTAVVATVAYGLYIFERLQKRLRLEQYLKEESDAGRDKGQRTVLHLVAHLGMTESEILDAALRSKHIRRVVTVDDQGRADTLLLEYK
jgi:hypothetical protein